MNKEEYENFYTNFINAERFPLKSYEEEKYLKLVCQ